jgi:hypothetical protein
MLCLQCKQPTEDHHGHPGVLRGPRGQEHPVSAAAAVSHLRPAVPAVLSAVHDCHIWLQLDAAAGRSILRDHSISLAVGPTRPVVANELWTDCGTVPPRRGAQHRQFAPEISRRDEANRRLDEEVTASAR